MKRICRLYLWLCRRWGPDGLTLSAWAWKTQSKWRPVIDRLFFWQDGHCRTQFERENRS